jgi:hypothetical protein
MFGFHRLEHLLVEENQHMYQNELKQYLLQYHELISEEP